jgi:hypothetical protein
MEGSHVQAVWDRAMDGLKSLGFRPEKETVVRVDFCVDRPGVSSEEYVQAYLEGKRVSRAKSSNVYENIGGPRGMQIGKGDTVVRVYDKVNEVIGKGGVEGAAKADVLERDRWGGTIPDVAARVEIQLRREVLRERFNVESVEDMVLKQEGLMEYVVEEWFRLVESVPTVGNASRSKNSLLWESTVQDFRDWMEPCNIKIEKPERRAVDQEQIRKQWVGLVETDAARSGKEFSTEEQIRTYVWNATLGGELSKSVENIRKKQADMAAAGWIKMSGVDKVKPK